jgi:hypothetical protein
VQQLLDQQKESADLRQDTPGKQSVCHTSAGVGRRKRQVSHCHHCMCQGRQTLADFVHFSWYPCTDLGPIGFCWTCYDKAAKDLLERYGRIVALASEIDALYSTLPDDQRRDVRPIHSPTYS